MLFTAQVNNNRPINLHLSARAHAILLIAAQISVIYMCIVSLAVLMVCLYKATELACQEHLLWSVSVLETTKLNDWPIKLLTTSDLQVL